MKKFTLLFSLVIFAAGMLLAQDETKDEKKSLTDNWESKLSIGFSTYSGNVNQTDLRSVFGLTRKDEFLESSIYAKGVYSNAEDKVLNREYEGGITLDYKPQNKLSPFMVLSAYQNKIKRYDLRLRAMAGAKWVFIKTETGNYSVSGAFLFDKENYTVYKNDEGVEIDKPDEIKKRISIRPKFKQKIGENVSLSGVLFYVANIEDFSNDYLIDGELSLTSKISEKINLSLSYEYDYDNNAADGIKKTDQAFIASLVFSF